MKKQIISLMTALFALLCILTLTACGSNAAAPQSSAPASPQETPVKNDVKDLKGKKILIAYFSRTGENYQVGNITKGNTHIVADMIAKETGGTLFEIRPSRPYPVSYKETTEIAKKELSQGARPELAEKVSDFARYDVIFLGYPIWWNDLPMPVYTFLESYDFSGRTIIPFVTSAGDVLSGKENTLPTYAKGASVAKGIGIEGKRAQQQPRSVEPQIHEWLKGLGII